MASSRSHFGAHFTDALFQLSQAALQGSADLLSNLLLAGQVALALNSLGAPLLVLFGHAVDVVGNVVNRLSKWVGRLAKNLNSFLHELNIFIAEATAGVRVLHGLKSLDLLGVVVTAGGALVRCCALLALLLFSDAAHFDFGAIILLLFLRLRHFIVVVSHQLASLFDKRAVATTLFNLAELLLLRSLELVLLLFLLLVVLLCRFLLGLFFHKLLLLFLALFFLLSRALRFFFFFDAALLFF